MSSPCPPTPLHPAPPCPALQRHARDIDERRNRLTQEQVAQRNKALHRTMQASNGRAAGLWPRLRPWLSGAEQDLLWLPWLLITVKTVPQNCPPTAAPGLPCSQVLLHASECTAPNCPSTSCARVKAMYHHAMNCPIKLAGNCTYCRCVRACVC